MHNNAWKYPPRKRRRYSDAHWWLGLCLAGAFVVGVAIALSHWRVLL